VLPRAVTVVVFYARRDTKQTFYVTFHIRLTIAEWREREKNSLSLLLPPDALFLAAASSCRARALSVSRSLATVETLR